MMRQAMVALRKESVDRNMRWVAARINVIASLSARRAWIEILSFAPQAGTIVTSLSARRAWIEMYSSCALVVPSLVVALRKESVDRNVCIADNVPCNCLSLSARRAWIEISRVTRICRSASVALRKESVDRNLEAVSMVRWTLRRSPQGERG